MLKSRQPLITQKVLVLHPSYVAGKLGVVCGEELLSNGRPTGRWLIRVDYTSESIIVSLPQDEFEVLYQDTEQV
ncbi:MULTISPECIES: hypothetical protein [Fischerella]|uniref:Uncharacterized protein n=1 Tax=Fischerella muscicola CCMEE 5323 TaxID=2019572 RepID=A0A2N6K1B2_FISMU|nr:MULTISPECIES: hypothetical protein [Fischerella]MBD2433699.1 hypothetical protein [Fischerella sp. FACHB-380]PLZ88371.1 hypothetical protein CEN44_15570 [Fischerella muscicola CCMEE 5323]